MKRKVVKMGLALALSAALLTGCVSSDAEKYKNDLEALTSLQNIERDFETVVTTVEDLKLKTDEGQAIKDGIKKLLNQTKIIRDANASGEPITDEETLEKMTDESYAIHNKMTEDLESFIEAATDFGIDEEDMEGLEEILHQF